MKKVMFYTITLLFVSTLSLVGMGNAGWFGDKDKAATDTATPTAAVEETTPATEQIVDVQEQIKPAAEKVMATVEEAMPEGEQLVLSGTIDENSQLVNEQGEIFTLADNDKGMEVKAMNGMTVEIKGTVMEEDGQKTVEIIEYNILK